MHRLSVIQEHLSPKDLSNPTDYNVELKKNDQSGKKILSAVVFSKSQEMSCTDFELSNSIFEKNFLIDFRGFEDFLSSDITIPVFNKDGSHSLKSSICNISQYSNDLKELHILFNEIEDGKTKKISKNQLQKLSVDDLDIKYYSLAFQENEGKTELFLIDFSRQNIVDTFGDAKTTEILKLFDKNHQLAARILVEASKIKDRFPDSRPSQPISQELVSKKNVLWVY